MPDEELKKRIDAFVKDYGELVDKHQIDFVNYPMFVPDGQNGFKIIVQNQPVDIKNLPTKSPFVTK